VRTLPADTPLNNHASISRFFTSPWFWEATTPAEHVLLFQADSILCSNSPQNIDDFLEYDFVGAPIDSDRGLGLGWNGGLSIRNRKMCLDIVKARSWEEERHGDHSQGNVDYEHQWFAKAMRELPAKPDGSPGANLPTKEVAMVEYQVNPPLVDFAVTTCPCSIGTDIGQVSEPIEAFLENRMI
jgi:hypothetical protein